MSWKKVGEALTDTVPLIATALGGPMGGIVGSLIAKALGTDPKHPDQALEKVKNDPQAMLTLVSLQNQEQESLRHYKIEMAKLETKNVENARATNLKSDDKTVRNISYLIIVGFFALLAVFFLFNTRIDPAERTSVALVVGALVGSFKDMINYYFGGSVVKKVMDKVTKHKA